MVLHVVKIVMKFFNGIVNRRAVVAANLCPVSRPRLGEDRRQFVDPPRADEPRPTDPLLPVEHWQAAFQVNA